MKYYIILQYLLHVVVLLLLRWVGQYFMNIRLVISFAYMLWLDLFTVSQVPAFADTVALSCEKQALEHHQYGYSSTFITSAPCHSCFGGIEAVMLACPCFPRHTIHVIIMIFKSAARLKLLSSFTTIPFPWHPFC